MNGVYYGGCFDINLNSDKIGIWFFNDNNGDHSIKAH